jgi:hypothetical protein
MLIQKLSECETFAGGDNTTLKELLHPDKQPLDLVPSRTSKCD